MQSTVPMTSPHKVGRRVLGEKTANASLTPASKRIADADSQKFRTNAIPFKALNSELQKDTRSITPEVRHAGQKRTIDQVVEDISETESEPRKVFMSSELEGQKEFEIFDEDDGTKASQTETLETPLLQRKNEESVQENLQSSSDAPILGRHVSMVPTEPAARRIFIQQRAALAKSRFQSALRHVENKSLDRVLSQYEANSRPFLRSISSSSPSPTHITRQQTPQKPSPTKQRRVLLPPLPLQPRARPVRSSAQKTAPSPPSESKSIINDPRDELDEEEAFDDTNDDDDADKTPKQSDIRQQNSVGFQHVEVSMSQESDSVMNNLIKWTQSSTESNSIEA